MNHLKKFVVTTAAIGTLGCNNPKQPKTPEAAPIEQPISKPVAHDALEAFRQGTDGKSIRFVEQNGQEVNFDTIKKWVGQSNSTLSFQFAGCTTICPRIAHDLSEATKNNPQLKNIVIATNVKNDFSGGGMLWGSLRGHGTLNEKNTKVLFPVGEGKDLMERLENGSREAARAQEALGEIADYNDYNMHTPNVYVYDGNGKQQMKIDTNRESVTTALDSIAKTSGGLQR